MSAELPVILSAIAGSATGIGGLAVFFLPTLPPDHVISLSLSIAGGVMMCAQSTAHALHSNAPVPSCVSLFDLWLPYAMRSLSAFFFSTLWFVGGMLACKCATLLHIVSNAAD